MSRIWKLACALLVSISVRSALADDLCVQCRPKCDATTQSHAAHGDLPRCDAIEMQFFIAEINSDGIESLSLAGADHREGDCSFRELAENLVQPNSLQRFDSYRVGNVTNQQLVKDLLRTLCDRGAARVIAQPLLVTCDGRPASMVIGTEVPIVIPNADSDTIEYRECGLRINCLPTVIDHETIRLNLSNELSWLDYVNATKVNGRTIPGHSQRRVHTSIQMRTGESVLLAGVYTPWDARPPVMCQAALANSDVFSHCPIGGAVNYCLAASAEAAIKAACEPKEFVVIVTAQRQEPAREAVIELTAGIDEADAPAPHRPAILLTPTEPAVEFEVQAAPSRARLTPPTTNPTCSTCPTQKNCCKQSGSACTPCSATARDQECRPANCAACFARNGITTCPEEMDENDDKDDEDEDEDDTCDEEIQEFIGQVLHAQMQYLDGMMRARLEHERQLLHTQAEAESVAAQRQLHHAEEILRLKRDHLAELQEVKETLWSAKLRAIETRHEQAVEHQKELFALKQKYSEELQNERLTTLQTELRVLRSRLHAEPERVVHTPDPNATGAWRRAIPVEMPIHVEDLASGRVRYAPVPPKPDLVLLDHPHDVLVERVEFSTPPITTGQSSVNQELDCLRKEVSRLRMLVEDILCFTPDFPPNPLPQEPPSDCDN